MSRPLHPNSSTATTVFFLALSLFVSLAGVIFWGFFSAWVKVIPELTNSHFTSYLLPTVVTALATLLFFFVTTLVVCTQVSLFLKTHRVPAQSTTGPADKRPPNA